VTGLQVVETGVVVERMTEEEASSITTRISVKLDAIADNYESVMPLIREALTREAHIALGYASPGAYVADRFGNALSRLGADLRRDVVRELSEAGLSTRAIAAVVSVSQPMVVKDRQRGDNSVITSPAPTAREPFEVDEFAATEPEPAADVTEPEAFDQKIADELARSEGARIDRPAPAVELVPAPKVTGNDGKTYPANSGRTPSRKALPDAFWRATHKMSKSVAAVARLAADDRFKSNADQIALTNKGDLIRARDALQSVIDQLSS
jgi:hypothetical protein